MADERRRQSGLHVVFPDGGMYGNSPAALGLSGPGINVGASA
jgi:hypothetical protein